MERTPLSKRRKANRIPILIIEDNADHWLIIRSALSQCFPEVEPVWINNVTQAITYLETHAADETKLPRLILSDLYLPRREEGLALLEFVKNHDFYRKPPVVMLSSSSEREDVEKAYSFSIASYIVKPNTYHQWLNCFYTFRRYWWDVVTLPAHPQ